MVAAGNSRKELDTMKSRIILNRERTAKVQEISIQIHGKGGELGIKAVTGLVGLIETLLAGQEMARCKNNCGKGTE